MSLSATPARAYFDGHCDELVDAVREATGAQARADAVTARRYDALYTVCILQAGGERGEPFEHALRSVALEVAIAANLSDRTVLNRMNEARRLFHEFSSVGAALSRGDVSLRHARVIMDEGEALTDPANRERYAEAAIEIAMGTTAGRLAQRVRRIVAGLEAEAVRERLKAKRDARSVYVNDLPDGMSELVAYLPSPVAHAIHDRLTQLARTNRQVDAFGRTLAGTLTCGVCDNGFVPVWKRTALEGDPEWEVCPQCYGDAHDPQATSVQRLGSLAALDAARLAARGEDAGSNGTGAAAGAEHAASDATRAATGSASGAGPGQGAGAGAGAAAGKDAEQCAGAGNGVGAGTGVGAGEEAGLDTAAGADMEVGSACESGDDPRTFDAIRADTLSDLLLAGAVPDDSRHSAVNGIQGRVSVTVPALAMAGVTDEPANLDGVGPIPLDVAMRIAGSSTVWQRVLTDPLTGEALTADTYRPSAELRRFIETRDQHCRAPGCRRPAHRCDLDHTHEYARGGATTADNLAALCRFHHVTRHHGWQLEQGERGELTWQSPRGRIFSDRPERLAEPMTSAAVRALIEHETPDPTPRFRPKPWPKPTDTDTDEPPPDPEVGRATDRETDRATDRDDPPPTDR